MIGKVSRGARAGGLLRYLFGPGRANEHTNPHLAAAWDTPRSLEPAVEAGGHRDIRALAALLEQPLQADARPPDRPVWHCSLRVAPGDRVLSDAEWDQVARTVLDRVGLAPNGDEAGCRWVAVRHAEDHVHLVVTLARQDGARVSTSHDFHRVGQACRDLEQQYGLTLTAARDRTAARRPTRGEQEKATRTGRPEAPRTQLQRTVREAAAAAVAPEDFFTALRAAGVLVRERFSERAPGQVTGYAVALPGDLAASGGSVWFGGGKLAPDLSWPKLTQRWATVGAPPETGRTAAYRAATHIADHAAAEVRSQAAGGPAAGGHTAAATADLLAVTARLVDGRARGPVTAAADAFDRAAREPWGRVPPRTADGQALRAAARVMARLGRARPGDRAQLLPLVSAIAGLVDAVAQLRAAQHRDAQADAARRAAVALAAVTLPAAPVGATGPVTAPRPRPPVRQPALFTRSTR